MCVWLLAISCLLLGTFSSGEELDTFSSEEKLGTFSSEEELDTFSSEEKLGTFSSGEELGTFSSGEEGVQLDRMFHVNLGNQGKDKIKALVEKLREKVRVLGEKLKRLPAKVKDAVVKALGNLKEKLHQRFGTVGQMISKAVKRVRAMKKEVQVVLLLVIGAVIGVFLIGLKVAWMHFGFLFWPCTATCKCLISCACKGLLFCCKGGCRGLSSCCKGGSSEDPEAQNQPEDEMKEKLEAEMKKKNPEAEMKKEKPEIERKKTSCCKGLSSCCKGGSSEDSEAQIQPEAETKKEQEAEMKKRKPETEIK